MEGGTPSLLKARRCGTKSDSLLAACAAENLAMDGPRREGVPPSIAPPGAFLAGFSLPCAPLRAPWRAGRPPPGKRIPLQVTALWREGVWPSRVSRSETHAPSSARIGGGVSTAQAPSARTSGCGPKTALLSARREGRMPCLQACRCLGLLRWVLTSPKFSGEVNGEEEERRGAV